MTNKQKLEREVIEALERTGLFTNISLSGDLEMEGNTLTIEYKRNPKHIRRTFEIERLEIEEIIEKDRDRNYPEVTLTFPDHPDEREIYTTNLTRTPLEGSSHNLTVEVLTYLLEGIRDNYLWKKAGNKPKTL